jgi:cyclophilin family peptidyl-prolyl cis-trans isomerase
MHKILFQLFKNFIIGGITLFMLTVQVANATVVRMRTSLGAIDIQLYDTEAPKTVTNFLNYVNSGAYSNSFIHRSVPGFVIQGGGFTFDSTLNKFNDIPINAPIKNEFSSTRSNLRGTIAMAKGATADSATNQWFFNLADNTVSPYYLDQNTGGFTVFGKVIGNGMQVVDAIATVPINKTLYSAPLNELPLIQDAYLVMVYSISLVPQTPAGWNLLGNSLNQPIQVASIADDPNTVTSIWQWVTSTSNWQFYSTVMDTAGTLQSYALSKGYSVLSTIKPGEGYWINANSTVTLSAQPETAFNLTTLNQGWNLVATANNVSPTALNTSLSATGINITTLWAWDNPSSKWYFYAPMDTTALSDYITGKGYLDFAKANKTLGNGTGFWVNR